ncbi:MAG: flagellar protein FlaB, partial [Desulfobacteraceae bacterium]|nr:flagellar protein FlaB [Desulfobacteraceae bacterium]
MTLRINTNIAAMNAHRSMLRNDAGLTASLEKLSSGLRINKAADDASGMAIADSLRSQGLSLGQAIKNANDGISMVQTADGALEESINIVNTIKTKAVQAAQDGQTTESRIAIQSDINKLMEELDIIAKTTSFNNQKLLSGNFTNKKFQIGAYSGETVNISIGTGESTKIGHISTSDLTVAGVGEAELSIYSNVQNANYDINSVDIQYDNSRENSMGALADAINKLSDVLGITASASVKTTTDFAINAGTTDSNFEINGVHIGQLTVQDNDSDGALAASINQKTDQHGVFASIDEQGKLTLTSVDHRAIEVTQGTDTTAVLGNTANMSTLGKITLTQAGTAEIVVLDRAGGQAVALTDNALNTVGIIDTTITSTLASGSVIQSGSTIAGGSVLSTGANTTETSGDVSTTGVSILGSGSSLTSGSIISSGTTITGSIRLSGSTVSGTGTLGNGTVINSGSTIGGGTILNVTAGVTHSGATISNLTAESTLTAGSSLFTGSTVNNGSYILTSDFTIGNYTGGTAADFTTSGAYTIFTRDLNTAAEVTYTNGGITLAAGSDIIASSFFADNSQVFGDVISRADLTLNSDTVLTTTTTLLTSSVLASGSNIIGDDINLIATVALAGGDMTLTAGSTVASASLLATDTRLSDAF